jgi:hypothetical protein
MADIVGKSLEKRAAYSTSQKIIAIYVPKYLKGQYYFSEDKIPLKIQWFWMKGWELQEDKR